MAGSPEADQIFLRALDNPELQPEMIGYIINVILGELRIPGFSGWDVCLEDTFIGSVGEIHYERLIEIYHDVSAGHTMPGQATGDLNAQMELAEALTDRLMRWCLREGLRTGIHLGKLLPRE